MWRCGDPGDKSCDTATNGTNGMWCGVYNLRRVNISHFKAVDSRRFCYFYIFTNFPIPAGKCREMVSNPEASRKPRKSLSRSPLPAITPARDEYGTMHTGTKPSCIGTFRIYVRTERKSAKEFNIIFL